MSLTSHSRAQFSNPGAVPLLLPRKVLPEKQPKVGPRVCPKCSTLKPPTSHHCRTCMRCVVKMDHHCPWVNNCVAIFNQKYFLLFLFWTALCCFYSGYLIFSVRILFFAALVKCFGYLSNISWILSSIYVFV